MYAISFAVSRDIQGQATVSGNIEHSAVWCQVQRHLNEAAVIFEPNIACQLQAPPATDFGQSKQFTRNAAHDPITLSGPSRAELRHRVVAREIVQYRCVSGQCENPFDIS